MASTDYRGWNETLTNAESILDFQENEVYVALVLARKKHNPTIVQSTRLISREVLTKENYVIKLRKLFCILKHYRETDASDSIKGDDCNLYLTVNPRSTRKALRNLKNYITEYDYLNDMDSVMHLDSKWISCLQRTTARSRKRFYIIDVDTEDETVTNTVYSVIGAVLLTEHKFDMVDDVTMTFDTRSGYHIVVPPFDVKLFWETLPLEMHSVVEVKTDDCVLLRAGNWID